MTHHALLRILWPNFIQLLLSLSQKYKINGNKQIFGCASLTCEISNEWECRLDSVWWVSLSHAMQTFAIVHRTVKTTTETEATMKFCLCLLHVQKIIINKLRSKVVYYFSHSSQESNGGLRKCVCFDGIILLLRFIHKSWSWADIFLNFWTKTQNSK